MALKDCTPEEVDELGRRYAIFEGVRNFVARTLGEAAGEEVLNDERDTTVEIADLALNAPQVIDPSTLEPYCRQWAAAAWSLTAAHGIELLKQHEANGEIRVEVKADAVSLLYGPQWGRGKAFRGVVITKIKRATTR